MREDQVLTAEMDVQRLAKMLDSHRGAFDVPPWAPFTDFGLPKCFTGLRGLPQRKITDFFFIEAIRIHSRTIFDRGQRLLREFAVRRKFCDPEVVRAIVSA